MLIAQIDIKSCMMIWTYGVLELPNQERDFNRKKSTLVQCSHKTDLLSKRPLPRIYTGMQWRATRGAPSKKLRIMN